MKRKEFNWNSAEKNHRDARIQTKEVNTVEWYLNHIQKRPTLSHAQSQELFQKMVEAPSDNEKTKFRNYLVESNTRLVISIAKNYFKSGIPFEDLIQEGNLGLIKAVERFDYTKGYHFSTYGSWWVKQAISQHVQKRKKTIRLPAHAAGIQRKMLTAAEEFRNSVGTEPSIEDLAELTGASETVVRATMQNSKMTLSLSTPLDSSESNGDTIGDTIQDFSPDAFDHVSQKEFLELIRKTFKKLPPKEATIIRLRYGITDDKLDRDFSVSEEEAQSIASGQGLV